LGEVDDHQGKVQGVTRAGQLLAGVGCQIQVGFAGSQEQQQTVPNYEVLVSTPPIPSGPFKIRTKSTGKAWSEGSDRTINVSAQPDDSSVRYSFVRDAGGGYRLSVNGSEIFENGSQTLSSESHSAGDSSIFYFEQQADIGSYRMRNKADNLY